MPLLGSGPGLGSGSVSPASSVSTAASGPFCYQPPVDMENWEWPCDYKPSTNRNEHSNAGTWVYTFYLDTEKTDNDSHTNNRFELATMFAETEARCMSS